ncbi:MAG: hypothetical protein K6E47_02090 [Lachnospiraceae bacterium]|nr:hypothetical protein [Lachnospiraceae bacterium]
MREFDRSAYFRTYNRKRRLMEKLQDLQDAVMGMKENMRERLVDKDNKLDEEKIEMFIDEMLDGLDKFKKEVEELDGITTDQKKLYYQFLYCVLIGPSVNSELASYYQRYDLLRPTETYAEIIAMAERIFKDCQEEYVKRDISGLGIIQYENKKPIASRFLKEDYFDIINRGIRTLIYFEEEKGNLYPPFHLSSDGDNDKLKTKSAKVLELILDPDTEHPICEKLYQEYLNDQMQNDVENTDQEPLGYLDGKDWYDNIPDIDRFVNSYRSFRKLWFSTDHLDFLEDIKTMIEIYLYRNEISAFAMDKRYLIIEDETSKTINCLCNDILIKRASWK